MKRLNLTVPERLKATQLLNEFNGNLSNLSIILQDIKQFPLSNEELEKVGGKTSVTSDGKQMVTWDPSRESEIDKNIDVQPFTLMYLKNAIQTKSDNEKFEVGDEPILSLLDKLNN